MKKIENPGLVAFSHDELVIRNITRVSKVIQAQNGFLKKVMYAVCSCQAM